MIDDCPLISVVVPVYNTEQYLEKCIESIRDQSYPNFEIILVDDGSTDQSGEICDRYSGIDSRIKVVHEENGGQAKARNTGISISTGQFLLFIDSDDYINEYMVEHMYNRIEKDQSDLAVCGHYFLDEAGNELGVFTIKDQVLTGYQMLEMAYRGTESDFLVNSIIWNKLYKRFLFDHVRFPEGRIQEDEATVYKLLDQCRKVSIISEPLYFYIQHANSTMTSTYSVRRLDGVEACYERYFYYREKGGDYLHFLKAEGDVFAAVYFHSKQLFKPITQEDKKRAREIDRMARKICLDNYGKWSFYRKLKLLLPDLYVFIGRIKKSKRH